MALKWPNMSQSYFFTKLQNCQKLAEHLSFDKNKFTFILKKIQPATIISPKKSCLFKIERPI